jgi:hypothetical protein
LVHGCFVYLIRITRIEYLLYITSLVNMDLVQGFCAYLEHLGVSRALADGEDGVWWVIEGVPSSAPSTVGLIEGVAKKAQGCTSCLFVEKKAWCFDTLAHTWMYPFISTYNMYAGLCLRFWVLKANAWWFASNLCGCSHVFDTHTSLKAWTKNLYHSFTYTLENMYFLVF